MDNLVPIGRFSKMTRLSIKALRLYDENGLLVPDRVDPSSGYRYYRPAQANRAEAIRILRSIEMPLDEIGRLLEEPDPAAAHKRLGEHRDRMAVRIERQQRMLRYVEKLMDREEGVMPYEVTVREVPGQTVLALRIETDLRRIGDDIGAGFGTLMNEMARTGAPAAGAPLIVYHDVIDEDTAGAIELCIPIAGAVDPTEPVLCVELAGGPMATTVHRGPYDEIGPAHHTLSGWIQDHGHEMAGPPREVYLNDPSTVAPEDILTEIDWPILP